MTQPTTKHRIFTMSFAAVYPNYVAKAEKKGRTKEEVDEIIRWLTGYSQAELEAHLEKGTNVETFFTQAGRTRSGGRPWASATAAPAARLPAAPPPAPGKRRRR